jgi:hypothetical protein
MRVESRGFKTAESTQQVCSASEGSYNWTEGQNKGRERASLYVPRVSGRPWVLMRSFFVMTRASLPVVSS